MSNKHPVLTKQQIIDIVNTVKNLRYDNLSLFIEELSIALIHDATKDMAKQRPKLANCLDRMGILLMVVKAECDKAWAICKSKMLP